MNLTRIENTSPFEAIKHINENGMEYWYATELLNLLDYKTWRRQKDTVKRAMIACENSGNVVSSHFANVDQMQQIGDSNATKLVTIDFKLTRYACYLVSMNGDPRKKMVAMAQSYFAVKTYEAETTTKNEQLTPELVANTIDLIFKGVNIKPELVAGVKLNAIAKINPALAEAIKDSQKLLIDNTASPSNLLTPTMIGDKLGLTSQKVNKLLIEKGLQVKNENKKSRKDPAYVLTNHGSEFGTFTLSTGSNGDNTSYQQLRWYESVLNVLM